ncbi:MAG: hypothetical protein K8U57_01435 [Planctomycetes bacterium]|nr:hypothetical protein [Planctomycetota bacterium]
MLPLLTIALLTPAADPTPLAEQPLNIWVKRSPLAGGPPSPGSGYEGSLAWDSKHLRVIRWAGHNQGGGGEQNAETWTFDPVTAKWELKEPNTSPPGACCNQQNLFDTDQGRFLRFPAFSGSHGWHWFRENYLSNSTVWNYDLATNTWRDRRPVPTPRVSPLRCASWDSDHQVAVIFGGEGSREGTQVYDPYTNTWHRMKPKDEPDPRSGGNMTYDPVNKLHVMFGTQFDIDLATWTYDLRKNTWTAHKPMLGPPTDRNDPVLAYDAASKRVIAMVRILDRFEGKEVVAGHVETWAFDAAKITWTKLDPKREPDGWSNRSRVMIAMPELNALLLESVINPSQKVKGVDREQQMWTYRSGQVKLPLVPTPVNVRVRTEKDEAIVEWDPTPGLDYVVHNGTGSTPWTVQYRAASLMSPGTSTFRQKFDPKTGIPYFRVQAHRKADASENSLIVRAQPRVADDLVASVISAKEVRLAWKPVPDAVGYHVERAPVEVFTEDQITRLKKDTEPLAEPSVGGIKAIGTFERITKEAVKAVTFTDTGIDLTKLTKVDGEGTFTHRFGKEQLDDAGKAYRFGVYAYRVRAVNSLGIEGGPSAWAPTIPSGVQHVFAKEDDTKCQVKWTANPEAGIKGYRVYRMDGPKINGAGQKVVRVTADPTNELKWTDETKGTDTKRYWIVAVDALGQEGIPSAPAWGWRQYRKVYETFSGEWHQ